MKRLVCLGAVALITSVASAQFINGDFETGNFSGWTITTTPNGMTTIQTVSQFDMDFGGSKPTTFAGQFGVGQINFQTGVPAGIEIWQSLNLVAGQLYVFSFDWAAVRNSSNSNLEGGVFSVIVGGAALNTVFAGSVDNTTQKFGTLSANFVPTNTGGHLVGARITRPFLPPGDVFQYVDNFAIPEPGTMIALGLGAAALLARRRRRKTG